MQAPVEWKLRVKRRLRSNSTDKVTPGNYAELAREVGAHKTSIQHLLGPEEVDDVDFKDLERTAATSNVSALVEPISQATGEEVDTEAERLFQQAPDEIQLSIARILAGLERTAEADDREQLLAIVDLWGDLARGDRSVILNAVRGLAAKKSNPDQ